MCVVAVALISRVWHLTAWDLWTDEVHTLTIARTGEYSFGPAYKLAPLNFILTHWAISVFGLTELGGRIAPFLAGMLTVIGTYWLGRRWIGRRAALFAALLLAVSPWHVYWSQNARHFSLEALFVLLSIHAFLLYWKSNSRLGIALTPAFIAAALSVHATAVFYLAAMLTFVVGSWLFWMTRRRAPRGPIFERRHTVAFAMLGVVLAAYVPISLSISTYLAANTAPWNPLSNLIGSLVFYVPPYIALVGGAGFAFLWNDRDDLGFLLLSLVVVPIVLVALASRVTIASAPYVLASLPPLALLTGLAIDRLLTLAGTLRAGVAVALVIAGLFGSQLFELALYHSKYRGLKPRWREAVEYVRAHRQPGDVIVAAEADVVHHYLGSGDVRWYAAVEKELQEGGHPFATATGVWFLVYTADEPLFEEFESARTRIVGSKPLELLLPTHYGAKDRTLGVFYEATRDHQ